MPLRCWHFSSDEQCRNFELLTQFHFKSRWQNICFANNSVWHKWSNSLNLATFRYSRWPLLKSKLKQLSTFLLSAMPLIGNQPIFARSVLISSICFYEWKTKKLEQSRLAMNEICIFASRASQQQMKAPTLRSSSWPHWSQSQQTYPKSCY